jgi:hypothetical protein
MSLVAKYARRDEDSDEESPTVPEVAPTSAPTETKKRESTTETEGTPTAKKAKLSELSDELVLPDYFKDSESTSTSMTGVQETKAPRQMQPSKGGLVPRQLQYVSHFSTHFRPLGSFF